MQAERVRGCGPGHLWYGPEAFRQAGGLLVKAWHCLCSVCCCFFNLSVCGLLCIIVCIYPRLCTYLCMVLTAPFCCVLCCLCVSTICVVSHLPPRLSWIMSCSLAIGCAGQSCVWDLCGCVLVSGPQLAVLPVPDVLGNYCKSEPATVLLVQNWIKGAGNSRAGFGCTGSSTHECL